MPVNMAVQEPRARIVRLKAERNIITTGPDADDISTYRICVVIIGTACDPYDVECMTMKVEGMLYGVINVFLINSTLKN